MAITSIDGVGIASRSSRGFWRRVFDGLAESQMRRARAVAKPYLLALDDESLGHLGHRRADVRRWQS